MLHRYSDGEEVIEQASCYSSDHYKWSDEFFAEAVTLTDAVLLVLTETWRLTAAPMEAIV
ncbi:MAG: hypothetical protein HEP71_04115 [Roseivirga sp.]|nr:hypothetical protein [Roseivirga sp.]